MSYKAINAYQKDSLKQQLVNADPHKLTLMLMSGAIDRLAYAKGAIDRSDLVAKSEYLSKATAIIINLRDTVDIDVSPEFGANIVALYNYMLELINEANINNSTSEISDVIGLLAPIRDAWASIPKSEIEAAYQSKSA